MLLLRPLPHPHPQVPNLLGRAQIFKSEALSSLGLWLSSISILWVEGGEGEPGFSQNHLKVWGGPGRLIVNRYSECESSG